MRRWLRIIAAILMSGLCAVLLILTWNANQFVIIDGIEQLPVSERLMFGAGTILFLLSAIFTVSRSRN